MIRNADGMYLFLRRSAASNHFKSQWEMPGGKTDPGETLEDCLVREAKEETGLDISLDSVMGAAEGEIPTYRLAYLILAAKIVGSDTITLSNEHDTYEWVTPLQALQLDLCPALIPFMQSLASNKEGREDMAL